MKENLRKALGLFWYFFKIGWYTFGGGWSIVAQIPKVIALAGIVGLFIG